MAQVSHLNVLCVNLKPLTLPPPVMKITSTFHRGLVTKMLTGVFPDNGMAPIKLRGQRLMALMASQPTTPNLTPFRNQGFHSRKPMAFISPDHKASKWPGG